ncbi:helix-turn-helix domain protein [Lactobacillus phage SAC12B]|uniref:Helix-turn-helix domain protein n=1 Tax=Lactobacillus phage SAC12B TaxID=2510941 RepID=A0A4Y5FHA0_9CAUD|nr:helix-turn-helix domain protein [Lactobacillus phage SAC12B]QBJ03898.1 helix-turn-helix domain protein [Lactobacillus phage SAC12B]
MKSNSNSDLEKLYNSEQYKLSNDLLSIRITKGMNQDSASKLLGIDKERYIELESGDINTSIEEYRSIILNLINAPMM